MVSSISHLLGEYGAEKIVKTSFITYVELIFAKNVIRAIMFVVQNSLLSFDGKSLDIEAFELTRMIINWAIIT